MKLGRGNDRKIEKNEFIQKFTKKLSGKNSIWANEGLEVRKKYRIWER
jgi:hypothetical protein